MAKEAISVQKIDIPHAFQKALFGEDETDLFTQEQIVHGLFKTHDPEGIMTDQKLKIPPPILDNQNALSNYLLREIECRLGPEEHFSSLLTGKFDTTKTLADILGTNGKHADVWQMQRTLGKVKRGK